MRKWVPVRVITVPPTSLPADGVTLVSVGRAVRTTCVTGDEVLVANFVVPVYFASM